ncbi:MAG: DNA polymerase IV [Prevotellaceae bacterium]|jgi:DNA polymerase-4|nr:DNA polymerase IV [Prevotellaceae bacterium]
MRKIIHIDMDAFYASVEQRDNEEYRGKPLAVGHAKGRGVVAAASYEARKYGVHSAMPSKTALRKCPHIIFVPARFNVYREVSRQIMDIFLEYTDLVEPLSLDEAFLDVTCNHKSIPSATIIAGEIKRKIKEKTGLTASAGVSVNKFLAKIASDYDKPNGLYVVEPKDVEVFVESLKIEQFFGVGKITAQKMHELGIHTGADLKRFSEVELIHHFGKAGRAYYLNARGIDDREVMPNRERKSIGAEETFQEDIGIFSWLEVEMEKVALEVMQRVSDKSFYGKTLTLKIKYADFTTITRSRTLPIPIKNFDVLWSNAKELLENIDLSEKKVRLLGLSVSNNEHTHPKVIQLKLDLPE